MVRTKLVNIKNEIDALEDPVTGPTKNLSDSRVKIEAEENNIKKILDKIKTDVFTLIQNVDDDAIDDKFSPAISEEITDMNSLTTKLNKVFGKINDEFTENLYKVINNFFSEKLGSTYDDGGEIAGSIANLKINNKELKENYNSYRSELQILMGNIDIGTDESKNLNLQNIKDKAQQIINDINKMKDLEEEYKNNTRTVYNIINGIIKDKRGKEKKETQYAKEKTVDKNFYDMNKSISKKRKTILALIIINVLITLVLLFGVGLVINGKSVSISSGLKIKKSRNNSNNKISSMNN